MTSSPRQNTRMPWRVLPASRVPKGRIDDRAGVVQGDLSGSVVRHVHLQTETHVLS
jgi:hypothetical protein